MNSLTPEKVNQVLEIFSNFGYMASHSARSGFSFRPSSTRQFARVLQGENGFFIDLKGGWLDIKKAEPTLEEFGEAVGLAKALNEALAF